MNDYTARELVRTHAEIRREITAIRKSIERMEVRDESQRDQGEDCRSDGLHRD